MDSRGRRTQRRADERRAEKQLQLRLREPQRSFRPKRKKASS